jgi:hypothetical protein
MAQLPVVVGLLLCEKTIVEAGTRSVTLVNCFSRRRVRSLPSEQLTFIVHAILTNGEGEVPLAVRIDRLDTLETITRRQGTATFRDPMAEMRLSQTIRDVIFPVSGAYQVVLLAGNELLANTRFEIIYTPAEQDE